ncbi:MAG: RimK/LysX family protein [Gammaproteobacteria bacterium]|nr:RimK/LysX family protein [Gammaproteobacteria bacterium]
MLEGSEKSKTSTLLIGWHEWCSLPDLGIPAIKAKIDTGARTSALHAFDIKTSHYENQNRVHFSIHPVQGNTKIVIQCHAPIVDERYIMSSSGHKELRCVILTKLVLGDITQEIQLTLSDRDPLRFRMLLGREALSKNLIINPGRSLCLGRVTKHELRTIYHYPK